jgi:hypothetical protein
MCSSSWKTSASTSLSPNVVSSIFFTVLYSIGEIS